jgi:hypothetical protein
VVVGVRRDRKRSGVRGGRRTSGRSMDGERCRPVANRRWHGLGGSGRCLHMADEERSGERGLLGEQRAVTASRIGIACFVPAASMLAGGAFAPRAKIGEDENLRRPRCRRRKHGEPDGDERHPCQPTASCPSSTHRRPYVATLDMGPGMIARPVVKAMRHGVAGPHVDSGRRQGRYRGWRGEHRRFAKEQHQRHPEDAHAGGEEEAVEDG